MNATDLSADVGLVAVGLVTANLLVGSLMAMRYSPWRCWPHRRFDIFRLHRWTGYSALAVVILHPIPLLFSTIRFRIVDIVYPVHSPSQPLENSIGAIALYSVVTVVLHRIFACGWAADSGKPFTSWSTRPLLHCSGTAFSPTQR